MKKTVLFSLLAVLFVLIILLIVWVVWTNTALQINEYTIESQELPPAFDGFRIAQVSDLHNDELGKENQKLLNLLQECGPDIIVITGDLIDSRNPDVEIAISFVKKAIEIAPLYYVTGNHESRILSEAVTLEEEMLKLGVYILHEEALPLELDSQRILIAGIDDPNYYSSEEAFSAQLLSLCDSEQYTVLLSHRPEYFELYAEAHADLVFTGHAHGGQFRLPFVGGLVAPNQGFFPEYDAGLYEDGETAMLVSRGIGNSIFPFRFNNRPEIVLAELHCSQDQ